MPHFNMRFFLQALQAARGDNVTVLQIGAMDGHSFDPLHEQMSQFNWNGVLVEPISEHFEQLEHTYANHPKLKKVRAAITDHAGHAQMHYVPAQHVEAGDAPRWALGIGSLHGDRNAVEFAEIAPFLHQEEVPCMTLAQLIEQEALDKIDVLAIDVEGHDYQVFKQLDLSRYRPYVITIEAVNLPKGEVRLLKRLLDDYGYLHTKAGYDVLAVHPAFFRDIYTP